MENNEKFMIALCKEYRDEIREINKKYHQRMHIQKVLKREAVAIAFASMDGTRELFQNIHKDETTMIPAFLSVASLTVGAESVVIEECKGCPKCLDEKGKKKNESTTRHH